MKLSETALELDFAITRAVTASPLQNPRVAKAITYRRYTCVLPRSKPFRKCDVPQSVSYHEFEPLLDSDEPQPDFKAYRAAIEAIEDNYHAATPFYTETHQLLFDTGASNSCTACVQDFISPIRPVQNTSISGIASELKVEGIGTVGYFLPTTDGSSIYVGIENVLFVPKCPTQLICPRQLLYHLDDPDADVNITTSGMTLSFRGREISIPYDPHLNIPILRTSPGLGGYLSFCQATGQSHQTPPPPLLSFHATNADNLTPAQQIKRKWHLRLNHAHYRQINHQWISAGLLSCDPSVSRSPDPICPACQYTARENGKLTRLLIAPSDLKSSPLANLFQPTKWKQLLQACY